MVHQHFKLVPSFTVAENIRLAALPEARRRLGSDSDIVALSQRYGLALDPGAITDSLPLAIQQRIEIFKALVNEARLLILDEPTTILNPRETEALYALLRTLAREGRAAVVVTHHLDEVLRYSDRVSVIRQGKLVGTDPTDTVDRATLVQRIVGRTVELDAPIPRTAEATGEEELRLVAVKVPGTAYSSGLRDVNLTLRAGEVVGIAGVEGNGQRELFDILAGLRLPASGDLVWREEPRDGNAPVSLVPEDRHAEGLVLDLSVSLNLLLDQLSNPPYSRLGRLRHGAIAARAKELALAFNVRAAGIDVSARSLSGGNQQKIVIARALQGSARVLVVYQPTRGLDVAASEEVLTRLRRAADEGIAVLMISSNLTEILRTSDRVVVFFEGRIAGETPATDADIATIGAWMVGGDEQPSTADWAAA
jgi:simple sugar transport system ATP-binding protein